MSFNFDDLAFPARATVTQVRKLCPSCEAVRTVAPSDSVCATCGDQLINAPPGALQGIGEGEDAVAAAAAPSADNHAGQAMLRGLMGQLAAVAARDGGGGGIGDGAADGGAHEDVLRMFVPALNSTYDSMVAAQRGISIEELMARLMQESALTTAEPASKKFVEQLKPRKLLPRDFLQLYIRFSGLPGLTRDLFPTAAAFGSAGRFLDEHAEAQAEERDKAARQAQAEEGAAQATATAAPATATAALDAAGSGAAKTTEAPSQAGPAPREHSSGALVVANPLTLAAPLRNGAKMRGSWVLASRGATSFAAKARVAQDYLARGLLVMQTEPDSKAWPYTMSDSTGKAAAEIIIPCVMISQSDGNALQEAIKAKQGTAAAASANAAAEDVRLSLCTRERPLACCVCREDYSPWTPAAAAAAAAAGSTAAASSSAAVAAAVPVATDAAAASSPSSSTTDAAAAAAAADADADVPITEAVELPCGHFFCDGCIRPWLASRANCPMCRFALPTDAPKEQHVDPPGPESNNSQLLSAMFT